MWYLARDSMDLFSIKEYLKVYIASKMLSYSDDNKLTGKELDFLTECCYFNSQGGNLSDFKVLWDYFRSLKFFKNKNDLSTYKKKLGEKRWIRGKRGIFKLPESLDILDKEDHFLVMENGARVKKTRLSFKNEYELKASNRPSDRGGDK